MISRIFALLVARFMFFIDDNRAEILEWRKYRRPRSDDDASLSALYREPRIVALAFAERRV